MFSNGCFIELNLACSQEYAEMWADYLMLRVVLRYKRASIFIDIDCIAFHYFNKDDLSHNALTKSIAYNILDARVFRGSSKVFNHLMISLWQSIL